MMNLTLLFFQDLYDMTKAQNFNNDIFALA